MATVTISNDFGTQENKTFHCFYFFSIYLPWSYVTVRQDLSFLMLNFKPVCSLYSFILIKRLFNSSWLSTIRMISSAYLRLLIFLLEILIPGYDSSSPAFHMMYSAYKSNKQGDNILNNNMYYRWYIYFVFVFFRYSTVSRILLWVAIPFSRGSSRPQDWTYISCIVMQVLYHLSH